MDDTSQGQSPSQTQSRDDPTTPSPIPRLGLDKKTGGAEGGPSSHPPGAVLSLKQAMRRARFDDAERSGVVSDLRAARVGRLEVLHEALRPLISQVPADVDCFDIAIMPGANPRLFVDMIGYVEMARDPRVYTFVQDTRHGRVKLAESESVETMVEAATQYVARRLLERDKALAADADAYRVYVSPAREKSEQRLPLTEPAQSSMPGQRAPAARVSAATGPVSRMSVQRPRDPTFGSVLGAIFAFVIDVLGSIAFFSVIAFVGWFVWQNFKH